MLVLNRNTKRRIQRDEPVDDVVFKAMGLSVAQSRWGYRKVYDRLKLDGVRVGRERVRVVRKRLKLLTVIDEFNKKAFRDLWPTSMDTQ